MNKKKIFKLSKGFIGRSNNCNRLARNRVEKALQYQYRDRRNKKRDVRQTWITQINAATRQYGLSYSLFMHKLALSKIEINRKILANLAVYEPLSFKALIDQTKLN